MFVVSDAGTTVATTLGVSGTTRMATRHSVRMYDRDIFGELLRQIVITVAVSPEPRGGACRVPSLRRPGGVRRSFGHGWVVTGTDTQRRGDAGDARKTSGVRYRSAIRSRTTRLRDGTPLSRGGSVPISEPQTGTGKTHTALFPAEEYKFGVRSRVTGSTPRPRRVRPRPRRRGRRGR